MRKYDLNDAIELKKLNILLRDVGVSVHSSLLSDFFVLIDEEKYSRVTRRNAGRRSLSDHKLITRIMTLRSEGKTIRQISHEVGVSAGTVYQIIRKHSSKDDTVSGQVSVRDLINE